MRSSKLKVRPADILVISRHEDMYEQKSLASHLYECLIYYVQTLDMDLYNRLSDWILSIWTYTYWCSDVIGNSKMYGPKILHKSKYFYM